MTAATIELRPYQHEALGHVNEAEARGVRRQLGVAATGLGKTIMFVELARRRGGRAVILVHRDELVRQTVTKLRELWPDVDIGIVKAADDDVTAHVIVASVQTLGRERRLARLVNTHNGDAAHGLAAMLHPTGPIDLVVVDEAHHAAADSYRRVLESFPDALILGVTATPDRGDGKGLDDLFDEIVFNYDILWGIRSGYLCDVRGQRVVVDVDLSGLKVRHGDFEQGEVGRRMEQAQTAKQIVSAWLGEARDRRTLCFTPTVAIAHQLAEEFRNAGIAAGAIDATTPLEERRRMLREYSTGDLQVLANCGVLTEGYDEPRTDCIVQARPTKSRALFTQMIGRGTRKHPDKADLLVLDIVGSSDVHSLVTVPSLFGFESKLARKMGDASALLSDVAQERDDHLVAIGKMRYEDANLFRELRSQGIAWVQVHHDGEQPRYQRTLSQRDPRTGEYVSLPTVVLTQREDGWLCGLVDTDGKKRVLIAHVELELAQGVGEDAVRKLLGQYGSTALVDTDAAWRKKRPSRKARDAARKWRLKDAESYKTAGDLSDALDAHIARVKAKKGNRA